MAVRSILIFLMALYTGTSVNAQLGDGSSILQAGGGWTSVIVETTAETVNGYILNGSFEKWLVSPVGIGGSLHYLHVSDQDDTGSGKATSLPVYLNGKYYVGKDRFRVFIKLSAGLQFSRRNFDYISGNTLEDRDVGFTAGGGAGLAIILTPKMLLNIDYSLYWLGNAYYSDGLANTASFNIGYILGN
jgi:hypothetical protein